MIKDRRDDVLALIKEKGPILPIDINKIMGNTLFAGAILSELADAKLLRISYAKIGGSPVYYLPGQEPQLSMLHKHLKDPEKRAFDLLADRGILRDKELQPVYRVALREIKDFAIPLTVTYGQHQELFWKWYLLQDDKATAKIKDYLEQLYPEQKEPHAPEARPAPEKAIDNSIEKEIENAKNQIEQEKAKELEMLKRELEDLKTKYKERDHVQAQAPPPVQSKTEKPSHQELQKTLAPQQVVNDDFYNDTMKFMKDNSIEVMSHQLIKKNSEIDFIIKVPSAVGYIEYYCKAKNKKRVNEGDISTAFVQGQLKKLPVLFLTPGDFTKKAKEMLKNEFKSVNTKQL